MKPGPPVPVKQFARDLKHELGDDNVSNGAAALAYYLTLAIFPGLIFLLTLLPYLPIHDLDRAIMDLLHQGLPADAANLLSQTVEDVLSKRRGGLLSFSLLATLWAASSGMYAIMQQLNITYDVKENRNFVKAHGTALLLTLLFGVSIVLAFALVVLGGELEAWIGKAVGFGKALIVTFAVLRWIIIAAFLLLGFALIYYLGPSVRQKFRWVSPGSVLGTILLIGASMCFRIYVEHFGNYGATYGSLGAVIILMLWLYVTGLVLLVGSEINSLWEHYHPAGKAKGERELPSPG
jgi:membrane protein